MDTTEDRKVITEEELEEKLAESIDESYPEVEIGYLKFSASRILKELDPIAWRIELTEYADMLESEEGIITKGYTD
jgi:hypothetical protein